MINGLNKNPLDDLKKLMDERAEERKRVFASLKDKKTDNVKAAAADADSEKKPQKKKPKKSKAKRQKAAAKGAVPAGDNNLPVFDQSEIDEAGESELANRVKEYSDIEDAEYQSVSSAEAVDNAGGKSEKNKKPLHEIPISQDDQMSAVTPENEDKDIAELKERVQAAKREMDEAESRFLEKEAEIKKQKSFFKRVLFKDNIDLGEAERRYEELKEHLDKIKENHGKLLQELEEKADITESEVEALPEETKKKIGLGLTNIGFFVEENKNKLFAKVTGSLVGLKEGENIAEKGMTARIMHSLSRDFQEKAGKARYKIDNDAGLIKSATSVGFLSGNLIKYGRLITDLTNHSLSSPLRYVMMGAMAVGEGANAFKEARLSGAEAIEKTRIADAGAAYEEAWKLYEQAQKGDKNAVPSRDEIEKYYQKNVPKDVLERLKNAKSPYATGIVEFVVGKDVYGLTAKINKKLDKIEKNRRLSGKEKEMARDKVIKKYSEYLKMFDRLVSQAGEVDAVAMLGQYVKTGAKAAVYAVGFETIALMTQKLIEEAPAIARMAESLVKSVGELMNDSDEGSMLKESAPKIVAFATVAGGPEKEMPNVGGEVLTQSEGSGEASDILEGGGSSGPDQAVDLAHEEVIGSVPTGVPFVNIPEGIREMPESGEDMHSDVPTGVPFADVEEGIREISGAGEDMKNIPPTGVPFADVDEGIREMSGIGEDMKNVPPTGVPFVDIEQGIKDVSGSEGAGGLLEIHNNESQHFEYQGGRSVWAETKNQLAARFGSSFDELGQEDAKLAEALKTVNIDRMENVIVNDPEKYGLPKDIDFEKMSVEQLKGIHWDRAFADAFSASELTEKLNPEQVENIIRNNESLREMARESMNVSGAGNATEVLSGNAHEAEYPSSVGAPAAESISDSVPVGETPQPVQSAVSPEAAESSSAVAPATEPIPDSIPVSETVQPVQSPVSPEAVEDVSGDGEYGRFVEESRSSIMDIQGVNKEVNGIYERHGELRGVTMAGLKKELILMDRTADPEKYQAIRDLISLKKIFGGQYIKIYNSFFGLSSEEIVAVEGIPAERYVSENGGSKAIKIVGSLKKIVGPEQARSLDPKLGESTREWAQRIVNVMSKDIAK